MSKSQQIVLGMLLFVSTSQATLADERIDVATEMQHVRQADPREWSEFPEKTENRTFERTFDATHNEFEWTLRLRHENVKQAWEVFLNGERLARLKQNENSIVACIAVPAGKLSNGENKLSISTRSNQPDDVRLGNVTLIPESREKFLSGCAVEISCCDAESGGELPCRITVLDEKGSLYDVGAVSNQTLAVRTGVIYTSNGVATFGLSPGRYRIVASRGPEYTIDEQKVELATGESRQLSMSVKRVVETTGWVACDTHVHTLTHSGHGDASLEERLIVVCGEAIELPIATDHNKQIDYIPLQKMMGLTKWFTPVVGNEVTTKWGHFNIFPARAGGPVPDHKLQDWKSIVNEIRSVAHPGAIILNHAEDVHSGFRPYGIENRHRLTGRQYNGWKLNANAMEVVNSGAQQTDMLRLPLDWMVNLNRGLLMTPVGSSDSHDVARHFVGQGRTYLRCDDSKPGQIDVSEAVNSFQAGRVIVSCGLFPQLWISNQYEPGDLVPQSSEGTVQARVQVWGAPWVAADRFQIYCNGELALERQFVSASGGLKHDSTVTVKVPSHDAHIELVVLGPGVTSLHWPIARPYQPTSPEWTNLNFGMTGAVWYDGNGDGKRNSAREIAEGIVKKTEADPARTILSLSQFHRSVCLQVAEMLHQREIDLNSNEIKELTNRAGADVQAAFQEYWTAWRDSEIARANKIP